MRTSLSDKKLAKALSRIRDAQDEYTRHYPGDSGARQPVHTVYGGANLFTADTARKLGEVALRVLEANAPEPTAFAEAIGVAPALATKVYERVVGKLRSEPVEDF